MNMFFGFLMLAATMFLFIKYRPKSKESMELCFLCGLTAILSMILSDGLLPLQAVEHTMQAVMVGCCFLRFRRERIFLNRRKERLKNRRKSGRLKEGAPVPPRACA